MNEKVIGLIPARMGSSRFPGKPICLINKYPMIYWVYEQAKKCNLIDEIYVVTPDKEIDDVCKIYNMPCIYHEVNANTAAQRLAYEVENLDGDIYLNIQGDEPLLEPYSLSQIIQEMINHKDEYYVGLYSLIENEEEFKNRNTVKTVLDSTNHAMYFSRSCIPEKFEYGNAYRVMGLYGYRPWLLKEFINIDKTELESLESGIEMIRMLQKGYKIKFLKTDYKSIGVDLPEHIEQVEKVMKKNIHR